MKVETPQEWAKRVAAEIRAGKLEPDKPTIVDPPVRKSEEELIEFARELGREKARESNVSETLRRYFLTDDEEQGS